MSGYFIGVFAICACLGGLGLISYNEKNTAERAVMGIILLYVVVSPIGEAVKELDLEEYSFDGLASEHVDEGYSQIGEAALSDGISRAIAEKYSLCDDDITVTFSGFDFSKMRGDRVTVLLSGRAAFADSIAIRRFVEEMEVGECDVKIEIGG